MNDRLRDARRRAGLSQVALAELIGASLRSVREWEAGRQEPSRRHKAQLADALGVAVDDLFPEGE